MPLLYTRHILRTTAVILLSLATLPAHAQAPALSTLLQDIWESNLKRSPVFASAIGDLRYNDQLPDLSPKAVNERIQGQRGFLARLLTIDTAGLSAPQRQAADFVQNELLHDEDAARFKQWELPLGIQTELPAMAEVLRFATVKDYDDYIARLHLVPRQLRQASENLLAGIEDRRVEPAAVIASAIRQTDELAAQTPDASAFARPLKQFPASIDAASRKRISADLLAAIQTDVLPAYVRFAMFLRAAEVPAAGPGDIPDHPLSYQVREQEVLRLRARATAALGVKFDLKAFHDMVTIYSPLPTDVLEKQIDAWIAATR